MRVLWFLLLGATALQANVTCTNNSSTDPGLIQAALTAGGAQTMTGTCALGTSTFTVNTAVTVTGGAAFTNAGTSSAATFTISVSNVTFSGMVFNGATVSVTGAHTATLSNVNFTNNTFENYTSNGVGSVLAVSPIHASSNITGNTFQNIWYGGFANTNSGNVCSLGGIGICSNANESLYVTAIFHQGGYGNNLKIENNTFTQILGDCIKLIGNGMTTSNVSSGVSLSYNNMTYVHRIAIELQLNSAVGITTSGLKVAGNLYYHPAWGMIDTYAYSLPLETSAGVVANNAAISDISGNSTTRQARLGYAFEAMPGFSGGGSPYHSPGASTYSGNVVSGDASGAVGGQWITGYYAANNGTESVANIPWSKYTQINHFAAAPGTDGSGNGNGTVNLHWLNQPEITLINASKPSGKQVLVVITDDLAHINAFTQNTAPGMINTFVSNIVSFVTSNGYDGVDIDWESTINVTQYENLITLLRAAMPTKLITVAAGDWNSMPTAIAAVDQYLDQVNVMCYDMDNQTSSWFNDALLTAGSGFETCDVRVGAVVAAGTAPSKIGVGIPFYGRRNEGVTTPGVSGSFTQFTEFYRDLVNDTTRFLPGNMQYDTVHKADYLSVASTNEFVTYTGTREIGDIVSWGKAQGYGGFMTFDLDYEYLASLSGDARYPLSSALYTAVNAGAGVTPPGWFDSFVTYDDPAATSFYQNTLQCGPANNTSQSNINPATKPHEVGRNNYTNASCPNGSGASLWAGNILPAWTSANNQSFPAGGNGTWSLTVTAQSLPVEKVDYYLDGSSTPASTQEIQDLSTTFSTDRKWLYHTTFSTTGLLNGTHTITAKVTDVSGATNTLAAQSFTVGTPAVVDLYLASVAAGAADGTSCANAVAYGFFNTATNWGSNGPIRAGTTVHVCGSITVASGANVLTAQGSGTAAATITVKFETGASLNAPYFSSANGAINVAGRSYITVDGGANGIIQDTANGTAFANHQQSLGIQATPCNHCEFKNLTIQNLYVHVQCETSSGCDAAVDQTAVNAIRFQGSNILIHDNTMHDIGWVLYQNYTTDTNVQIYNNNIYNMDHGLTCAGAAFTVASELVYNNHFHDMQSWDTGTADVYHHDGIHCFNGSGGKIQNLYLYNNLFDGNEGVCCVTSWVFLEGSAQGTPWTDATGTLYAWNNVFIGSNDLVYGQLSVGLGAGHKVYNNSISGAAGSSGNGVCYYYGTSTAVTMENNVAQRCNQLVYGAPSATYTTIDYNAYGTSTGGNPNWQYGSKSATTLSAWQTACACDAHVAGGTGTNLNLTTSLHPQAGYIGATLGLNLTSLATGNLVTLAMDSTAGGSNTAAARSASANWAVGAFNLITTAIIIPSTFEPVVTAASGTTVVTFSQPVTLALSTNTTTAINCTSGCSSVTITGPAHGPLVPMMGGCPVAPADSIWTTPINTAPVAAHSANWIAEMTAYFANIFPLGTSWGPNFVDSTNPATSFHFFYTTALNGYPWQFPPRTKLHREGGAYAFDTYLDHHVLTVNHSTCQFYESYKDNVVYPPCPLCTATSGYTWSWTPDSALVNGPYDLPQTGTTTVAGLPISNTTVTLQDIHSGTIRHPMAMTVNAGEWLVGHYTDPPACTTIVDTAYWPSLSPAGHATCGQTETNFPGAGAMMRLKSSYNIGAFSPTAQTILTGWKNYGLILQDTGSTHQPLYGADCEDDPLCTAAVNSISNAIPMSAFEFVDVSALQVSPTSSRVAPSNADAIVPRAYAVLTASASGATTLTLPVAIEPVGVGTPYETLIFQAGTFQSPGYQIPSWVTNTANQAVTWTITNGPGAITSGGVYTPPASATAITRVAFQATATADNTAHLVVYGYVMPADPITPNSVWVDTGGSGTFTDPNGHIWYGDNALPVQVGQAYNPGFSGNPWGTSPNIDQVYQTQWGAQDDIWYAPFVLPAGNYQVRFLTGHQGGPGTWNALTAPIGLGDIQAGLNFFGANGRIQLRFDPGLAVGYVNQVPSPVTIPATVGTDNILHVAEFSQAAKQTDYVVLSQLNGLSIVPDTTTPPAWVIDLAQQNQIPAGSTAQLYVTDQYTGQSCFTTTCTWSVVSGPGSITSAGLYTAPAGTLTQRVNVQVTNGTYTATAAFIVLGTKFPVFAN